MDNDIKSINAKANAGMATGITALGIEAAGLLSQNGGLGNLLGNLLGNGGSGADTAALISAMSARGTAGADAAMLAMLPALAAMLASQMDKRGGCCNEDHLIDRYEASKDARIAQLETEVKLRDANTYTDQKLLEMYKYLDAQLKSVNGEICRQAVKNQETSDAFQLVRQDIARERDERKCADNSIVTYANATFYPKQIADITTGTGTTPQALYNPLPSCGC